MKGILGTMIGSTILLPTLGYADTSYFSLQDGDGFKRFSVSVGALHVMPQGKAQPFKVNTAVQNGESYRNGAIGVDTVLNNLDPSVNQNAVKLLLEGIGFFTGGTLPASLSGSTEINGLSEWNNPGTGLEADDVTTLGIMTNYFFTDNVSLEIKAGIPPKVDLQGKGRIYAPFSGTATPTLGSIELPLDIVLKKDIEITDLEAYGPTASARAWTPAFEFQYHFGKTGVNKFRPYIGVGLMYAYFNELEINPQTEQDLIKAGHMIANILDNKAGASLENTPNEKANPKVKLDATDTFAPVVTAGFTYDFNDKWFAVGSISYAHLKNETTITVIDDHFGKLIESKADIEVNPLLAYAGIGIRF
ncbi:MULTISPECIES: OmpW family protein [Acinetobacter]|uniref:OmpW/AlkL family protein n=1 Tax=Acinetobacter TaxID=469 RepID=UPI000537BB53|nr:OmpW family outer membrane protein [Acinetobacter sp. HR7]KGT48138.1 hypothetical protein GW12_08170 [Acinetobacter sp. HR7]